MLLPITPPPTIKKSHTTAMRDAPAVWRDASILGERRRGRQGDKETRSGVKLLIVFSPLPAAGRGVGGEGGPEKCKNPVLPSMSMAFMLKHHDRHQPGACCCSPGK